MMGRDTEVLAAIDALVDCPYNNPVSWFESLPTFLALKLHGLGTLR